MKRVQKLYYFKSALSHCVDKVTGEADIADMWRNHYEDLFNCNTNTDEMVTILDTFVLSIEKYFGLNGLNGESLKMLIPYCAFLYLSVLLLCLNTITCHNLLLIR